MKAINRLFEYFEFKHIKPTRFEKDYGLSNGYLGVQLKREADIGSSILETIIKNCSDLDIIWLITGSGNMLMDGYEVDSTNNHEEIELSDDEPSSDCTHCKKKEQIIAKLQKELKLQKEWATIWLQEPIKR
ncbi:MAG: hypothetical protein WCP85_27810 [Mariniphaga sp.]